MLNRKVQLNVLGSFAIHQATKHTPICQVSADTRSSRRTGGGTGRCANSGRHQQSTFAVKGEGGMKAEQPLLDPSPCSCSDEKAAEKSGRQHLGRGQDKGLGLLQKLPKHWRETSAWGREFRLIWILFLKSCKLWKSKCFAESAWYPNAQHLLCQTGDLRSDSVCTVVFTIHQISVNCTCCSSNLYDEEEHKA